MLMHLLLILPEPIHWVWTEGFEWAWNPESGNGYGFFSSVGGTPLFAVGAFAGAYRLYRKHIECHETGCTRRGKYVIEGGVRCCELHHPAWDSRPPAERGFVHKLHLAHLAHVQQATKEER